jgi:ribonuclease E
MLDSEPNSHETDNNDEATGHAAGAAPAPTVFDRPAEPPATSGSVPAVPAALFQPPQVLFQPPAPVAPPPAGGRPAGDRDAGDRDAGDRAEPDTDAGRASRRTRSRGRNTRTRDTVLPNTGPDITGPDDDLFSAESAGAVAEAGEAEGDATVVSVVTSADEADESVSGRRRRRRNTRGRGRADTLADTVFAEDGADSQGSADDSVGDESAAETEADSEDAAAGEAGASGRRRRRKRRRGSAEGDVLSPDDPPDTVVHVREAHNPADDVRTIKGSTRLEAKKQRRREGRESGRRRPPVITESEFLARRESVDRTMVVRQRGDRTQIAVLEDGVLVEHYVNRTTHASYVGNVYLGKVQNVLPSMEAAFVDIGKGRNAVLYAGEVNFDASGLEGQPKRIESALKPGQSVIVQVTKDPVGHKGARLTSQVSLPGRYLVYVPGASMTGISRKLPDTERTRLKQILKKVTPENAGVIVRTAAEGAAEAELDRDITRLAAQWENIEKKAKTATAPALLYGEPDLTIRVVRDVFNEDFSQLIVSGDDGWEIIDEYVRYVAPHLADRISRWDSPDNDDAEEDDVFAAYRIDEQLAKALERKVWLPSGGSLVIDRTEAMTVIDVNTGKFTGQGGNLEETVTRNNLEAAEEIVRQLRLRDVGGIVVIDFIDMVLESNRELVLRRLLECLARDRTKHQVAEVTSLGLVQMTRKRVGAGLLEAFSQQCECCNGRGVIITLDAPAEPVHRASAGTVHRPVPAPPPGHTPGNGNGRGQGNGSGSTKAGYGNGRRGNGRRDDDRAARDAYADTALADEAQAGAAAADEPRTDTVQAGGAPVGGTQAAAGDTGTADPDSNGTRRTRRSTSAGTAFATAVLIDDTPAPAPVGPAVPSVTDPAPSGSVPVVTGDPAPAEAADPSAPPVRRTRAGSAVARVTVAADPEPVPAPAADAAPPSAEEAQVADAAVADASALPPVEEFPATEAVAMTAGDATAPPADEPAGSGPESESKAAAGIEPAIVAAGVFGATPEEPPAPVTEVPAPAESFSADPVPAETVPDLDAAADSESAAAAVGEPALEAASAFEAPPADVSVPAAEESAQPGPAPAEEVTPESGPVSAADAPAQAEEGSTEAVVADAAGEPVSDEPGESARRSEAASAEGEAPPAPETSSDGEPPTWA